MKTQKHLLSLVLILFSTTLFGQVTTDPSPIPVGYTGPITLTFNPYAGNGGMSSATACYAHIGLLTENSTSAKDWKYIKVDAWGTTEEPAFTKTANNRWEYTIPNINEYFGCPATEKIIAIVMVFHDGNGKNSKEGKTASKGDIIIYLGDNKPVDIWEGFTPAAVINEARPSGVVNGIYYGNDGTSVTLCTYAASKTQAAQHVFLLGDMTDWKLDNNYQLKKDGNYFWITLTGLEKGKEYRFQYAVVRADGTKKQISDLYSEKVLYPEDNEQPRKVDPTLIGYPLYGADGGYVTVIQPGKPVFQWSEATLNFNKPDKNNLVIYELWVYDHTPERSFEGLMKRLDYIENLGVNAVELMPITEYENNVSWGYNPTHYFAIDKTLGTPEQFKTLVDECHKRGIAVILDMVFNHTTGLNPMAKLYPKTDNTATQGDFQYNPWFNLDKDVPHKDYLLEDWNHAFEPTHQMFTRVLQYWINEYKIDGYRMDMSYGLCGTTDDDITQLKDYYTNGVKAANPNAYFICEHWDSGRDELINEGMMCWTEGQHKAFQQVAMGWLKDGDALISTNKDNYVSYVDSHDEERCFFKCKKWGAGTLPTDEAARCNRVPATMAFLCMLNGPKMFYHFAELGYDNSKYQTIDGLWGNDNSDEYNKGAYYGVTPQVQDEVKMWIKKRPEEWMKGGVRMQAYQKTAQIIQLRTRLLPKVFEGDPTYTSLASGVALRKVQWGENVYVAANFHISDTQTLTLPTGTWYDYLAGGTTATTSYTLQPGEVKIFTGQQIVPPAIPDSYDAETAVEYINIDKADASAKKILLNGQILIIKGEKVYNLMGERIQ